METTEIATPDIESVFNWDAAAYLGDQPTGEPFFMEVEDRRRSNGQLMVCVAPQDGNVDDMLNIALEITKLPGSKTDVQCLHVAFDADNMAFSLFKQGDSYILRPEKDVALEPTVLPDGTRAFIVK